MSLGDWTLSHHGGNAGYTGSLAAVLTSNAEDVPIACNMLSFSSATLSQACDISPMGGSPEYC